MTSMYRGTRKFDREQLVFVAEVILAVALETIEAAFPDCDDQRPEEFWKSFRPEEFAVVQATGMALAVLYAQLTGYGIAACDALALAGGFDKACKRLITKAWERGGDWFEDRINELRERSGGVSYNIREVFGDFWVDTRRDAELFVDEALAGYLR